MNKLTQSILLTGLLTLSTSSLASSQVNMSYQYIDTQTNIAQKLSNISTNILHNLQVSNNEQHNRGFGSGGNGTGNGGTIEWSKKVGGCVIS